ncbi:MAG: crossover junction endodeoxyribonuclease RuvC [Candidatus Rhabdochlamydia sp.]
MDFISIVKDMHKKSSLVILGIDPGTKQSGYGVIKVEQPRLEPLDFGVITPPAHTDSNQCYLILFNSFEKLLTSYKPDAVSIETQFVDKNVKSAFKIAMVRSMAIVTAARQNIPVFEYAPKKAKLAVVGNGSASKEQVQKMVQLILRLSCLPEPEDAADALALAICHANTLHFNSKKKSHV